MKVKKKLANGEIKIYTYDKYSTKSYRLESRLINICEKRWLSTELKRWKEINRMLKMPWRYINESEFFDDTDILYIQMMQEYT